jgi:hypothetical protein
MLCALDRGMEIKNFTELIVWQRAMDLIVDNDASDDS